jgi:hypothetical protein
VPDLSMKNAKFCTTLKFPGIQYTALTTSVWVCGVHTACTYTFLASFPGSSSLLIRVREYYTFFACNIRAHEK